MFFICNWEFCSRVEEEDRSYCICTVAWNRPFYVVTIWRGLFFFLLDLCSLLAREHRKELGEILEKMKELGKTGRKAGLCHGIEFLSFLFYVSAFATPCSNRRRSRLSPESNESNVGTSRALCSPVSNRSSRNSSRGGISSSALRHEYYAVPCARYHNFKVIGGIQLDASRPEPSSAPEKKDMRRAFCYCLW